MKERIPRGRKSLRWRRKSSQRTRSFDLFGRFQRALSWLLPGLVVKRWMLISVFGLIVASFGLIIWADLRPIYWGIELIFSLIGVITKFLPSSITGPILFLTGISLLIWGQNRSFKSIQKAVAPEKDDILINALRAKSRLNRGPNIVAIGGGTGLSTLLMGLKRYSKRITAIVTVADDGGSSGILRRELGVQPPGDIRNCLAALATEESLITRLFQYRFSSGTGLVGHSFGNLFLSALTSITGNLEAAITASSRVLDVRGQVVPATNVDVRLWAELQNGDRIEGESAISEAQHPIVRIGCFPEKPPALPSAIEALENAELIVLGPGSLYTSLLPNLLIPQIVEAIQRSKATKLYICNLMTQPGETDGLDVSGHVRAIEGQLAIFGITKRIFDIIIAQKDFPPSGLLDYYLSRGAEPVKCDVSSLNAKGYKVFKGSLQSFRKTTSWSVLRHDPKRLSLAVMRAFKNDRRDI